MGWFTNEYQDKINSLEAKDFFNGDVSIAYELNIMRDCERKLTKIIKILDKYDENEADVFIN